MFLGFAKNANGSANGRERKKGEFSLEISKLVLSFQKYESVNVLNIHVKRTLGLCWVYTKTFNTH